MPVGISADLVNIEATEALSAGDFINIHNDTGAKIRKAPWRAYWDSGKDVMVGAINYEPTRIGLWDNQDIELYPYGTGQVNVRNNSINIPASARHMTSMEPCIRMPGLF